MNVSELAKSMNVTENDLMNLVNMVVTSMKADGIISCNIAEEDRSELVAAYIQAEVKKFHNFCITLLTNQEKRDAFSQYMIHNCA